ncbi:hypothetical protein [Nitratireductor pacificus]|uniref:hypothetical protein n=1 Tax=Nitratireductor pacificus TaxID=1231180 RepID=UPI0002D2C8FA|nr:hypothetical protein [Nitratireductor pacificus]
MARRRRTPPKVTAARVELYLDKLAEVMSWAGENAHLGVPLWKRLEKELERLREEEAVVDAARARLTRSTDRTAGQSA